MIRAILIDDELNSIETLSILLANYCPEVEIIDKCMSAKKGLEAIESLKPELVFLDIEMPIMNGFELLEQIKQINFCIIFTTSYDQYAIRAFQFSALDYLLKPIGPKELVNAVSKVQSQKSFPSAEQLNMLMGRIKNEGRSFTKVAVPTAEGFELIPSEEIIFCEATDNYTYFFLKSKEKIIACRTLKEIETRLNDFEFFIRVHHSYIINLNEVKKYVRGDGGYLVMCNGATVNVSRNRKDALLKWFS